MNLHIEIIVLILRRLNERIVYIFHSAIFHRSNGYTASRIAAACGRFKVNGGKVHHK